jgi:hypothetical protein
MDLEYFCEKRVSVVEGSCFLHFLFYGPNCGEMRWISSYRSITLFIYLLYSSKILRAILSAAAVIFPIFIHISPWSLADHSLT